jgi:glucose-6-phosphate dehydrogenase assembly protein OpcA
MAESRLSKSNGSRKAAGSAPMANVAVAERQPIAVEREVNWQAHTIEANTVHKTLQRLWDEIGDQRRAESGRPRVAADAALMRTRTINLIAVADTGRDAARIKRAITALTEFFPSRTVILVRNTGAADHDGLSVSVAVEEHPKIRQKTPVRFETITVSAGAGREELLASVAAPILVSELPDFVWFTSSSFADSPLLGELVAIADRLIVDTSLVRDPARALKYLVDLEMKEAVDGSLNLSDFVWMRLMPWRQMIAQFFDQAATQPSLDTIDAVTITYAGPDENGRSGLTAGLLMAGWLCTRLGWRAPGEELVRSRDGWKLTLRAGARGRSREVILTLKATNDPAAGVGLGSVAINAGGNAPGTFKVERSSGESVVTTSEVATTVNRTVYLRNLDDSRLLSLELRVFGSDPIYYEALHFAANLWPEGTTIE